MALARLVGHTNNAKSKPISRKTIISRRLMAIHCIPYQDGWDIWLIKGSLSGRQGTSSKITPLPSDPPDWVAPYRTPLDPRISPATGRRPPVLPENVCRTVSVPVCVHLEHHPLTVVTEAPAPAERGAVEIPGRVHDQPRVGYPPSFPPVKVCSTVSVPSVSSLNTTP